MSTRETEGFADGDGAVSTGCAWNAVAPVVSASVQAQQAPHAVAVQAPLPAGQYQCSDGAPVTSAPAGPNAPAISKPVSIPTNFQAIPHALQALPQWVAWRYVFKDGKWDKVPFDVKTGQRASSTDPATWSSFAKACKFAQWYDGIGFVLVEGNGLVIIDLDDKPEHPASEEDIKFFTEIVANFPTYTERSVGGHGVHIVAFGALPEGVKGRRTGHVEIYSAERYLTFTGNTNLDGLRFVPDGIEIIWEIENCQWALDYLLGVIGTRCKANHTGSAWNSRITLDDIPNGPQVRTDAEIWAAIERATNFEAIKALCSAKDANNDLDASLMQHLVFYSPNNEQVLRMFKATALAQRDKVLVRKDYILNTLNRARLIRDAEILVELEQRKETQKQADLLAAKNAADPKFQKLVEANKKKQAGLDALKAAQERFRANNP